MEVKQLSAVTTTISYLGGADKLRPLLLISDVHWDSKDCDRALLKKHLDYALEKDAAIVIVGDFFDLMEGRNDMRRANKAMSNHYAPNYLQKVVMDASEWLKPYVKNIAVISDGNHETSITRHIQVDPLEWLCYELNKQGSPVVHGKYQGFIIVKAYIGLKDKKNASIRQYVIYYHHGLWGGVISKGTQSVMRFGAVVPDADMVITGHTHDQWMMLHTRYKLLRNGDVKLCDQVHLKLGTYKNEFESGGGFAVEKIGLPKPIGGWFVELSMVKTDGITTIVPKCQMLKH